MVERSADLLGLAGVKTLAQTPVEQVRNISLEDIIPNAKQSRTVFLDETIQELAESIKTEGLIQPITVRLREKDPAGSADGPNYEIVAGERRWRAYKHLLAGGGTKFNVIPAFVREVEDRSMRRKNLVENIEREDLCLMDLAKTYQELKEEYGTSEEVARVVRRSPALVYKYIRIAEASDELKEIIKKNELDIRGCEVLLALVKKVHESGNEAALSALMDELKTRELSGEVLREIYSRVVGEKIKDGFVPPENGGTESPVKPAKQKGKDAFWQVVKEFESRLAKGEVALNQKETVALISRMEKFLKACGLKKAQIRI